MFVDGCFWHMCPLHAAAVQRNGAWSSSQLDANVTRGRATDEILWAAGWTVLRIWEHEPLDEAVRRVEQAKASEPTPRSGLVEAAARGLDIHDPAKSGP